MVPQSTGNRADEGNSEETDAAGGGVAKRKHEDGQGLTSSSSKYKRTYNNWSGGRSLEETSARATGRRGEGRLEEECF